VPVRLFAAPEIHRCTLVARAGAAEVEAEADAA
jgi:hypothetical protein